MGNKFKVLVHGGVEPEFVNMVRLATGIYSCSKPMLLPPGETKETLGTKLIGMEWLKNQEPVQKRIIDNLNHCRLVEVTLTIAAS